MAEQSKIVEIVKDSLLFVSASSFIGWVAFKAFKEQFLNNPTTSFMNFGKWVGVGSGSLYLIGYLKDKEIIPDGF